MSEGPERIALVTGSATGVGRHLAERLLDDGYVVVGCSRREAEWDHPGYTHLVADVTAQDDVDRVMRFIAGHEGQLAAVVNNAGAASMNHALLTPVSTWEKLLSTNLMATVMISREAVKLMRKTGGRIVNVSSVAVPLRLEGHAAYAASKGAMHVFTQVLAREVASFGITVNIVGAPPIETDMIRGVPQDKIDKLLDSLPIKRLGTVEDVANVVEFFLRPESSGLTGQVLYVGGAHDG